MFSQKKLLSIEEARTKVYTTKNMAADAAIKFDEAFLAWALVLKKYLAAENIPNKTEDQLTETFRVYKEMCLAWKIYETEILASREACLATFNATSNLHLCMQREILN